MTKRYFFPVHRMDVYQKFARRALPVTDWLHERLLCIPLYSDLPDVRIDADCPTHPRQLNSCVRAAGGGSNPAMGPNPKCGYAAVRLVGMTSRLEPGDQILHLAPPLQGETQHRVCVEPVHMSPQFLIGRPNLIGFADRSIQMFFFLIQMTFGLIQIVFDMSKIFVGLTQTLFGLTQHSWV